MAIFKHRLTKKQIQNGYTHYARMYGIVPIYFNERTNDVCVRNGWPEWLLDLFNALFDMFATVAVFLNPLQEINYPILLGREIPHGADECARGRI